jgi:hypothetical protein
MGFSLEVNNLLRVPAGTIDMTVIQAGQELSLTKPGIRLYPIDVPIELCDEDYHYIGKVKITKLILGNSETTLSFLVLKVFSPSDAAAFSNNFIPIKND